MTRITRSQSASLPPMAGFEDYLQEGGRSCASETAPVTNGPISENPPEDHGDIDSIVARHEQDERRRKAIEEARRWVADTYYTEQPQSIRNLRLKKGWSQSRLAAEVGTSQPHIARIERGTEDVRISTIERLAAALGVKNSDLFEILSQARSGG